MVFQCKKHKGLVEKDKSKQLSEIISNIHKIIAYDTWPDKNEKGGYHFEPL